MAKKIIILQDDVPRPGVRRIRFCFWFDVPPGNEMPASRSSAYADATPAELDAIALGTVLEYVHQTDLAGDYTPTELKDFATRMYTAIDNAFVTDQPAIGYPGKSYGTYWDGTSWSAG